MPRRSRSYVEDPELRQALEHLSGRGSQAAPAQERVEWLQEIRAQMPAASVEIDRWLLQDLDELRSNLEAANEAQEELRHLHDKLTSPPWHAAVYLRPEEARSPRAVVVFQHAQRVVTLSDDVSPAELSLGDDVLLSHDANVILRKLATRTTLATEVAEYQGKLSDGRFALRFLGNAVIGTPVNALDVAQLAPGDCVRWSAALGIVYEALPRQPDTSFLISDVPTDRFEDIGGLDTQIERLQRAVRLHVQHPDLVARYGLKRAGSVLLVGPPGTGKTMLARALARWLGDISPGRRAQFFAIKPGALHSMWYGQSEANYRELFRAAREASTANPEVPVVMFFDEIDSIGVARSTGGEHRVNDRVLTSFMAELDGLERRGNILVVSATNRRDALDAGILRSGRLSDIVLDVPRPNMAAGRAILERHFKTDAPYANADGSSTERTAILDAAVSRLFAPNGVGEVASVTFRDATRRAVAARDLVSGAMLANLARAATERACIRELATGEAGIRASDVLEALEDEIASAVATLTPYNCHHHLEGLPQDLAVARVEPVYTKPRNAHRLASAA